jgi:L,D-transpeptidase ErfK/SrfK
MTRLLPRSVTPLRRATVGRRRSVPLLLALLAAGLGSVAAGAKTPFPVSPTVQVIGAEDYVTARHEDTLIELARRHGLGYEEIIWANREVDPWLPGEGTAVRLPRRHILPTAPQQGVVVNIAEYRMYYYTRRGQETVVTTFPISIGRMDWATPLGRWQVVAKQKDPAWYPPESIRREHLQDGRGFLPKVVPPGPNNPLGRHAMRLSVSGYLIHGTNEPRGIGMQVTHGCIRMYPEDIEWLFGQIPVSTPVTIVNQPVKFGWIGDELYLEVIPPLEGDRRSEEKDLTAITEAYVAATRDRTARVDWELVEEVFARRDGVPVKVGEALAGSGNLTTMLGTVQAGD